MTQLPRPKHQPGSAGATDAEIAVALGPIGSGEPIDALTVTTKDGKRRITCEPDIGAKGTRFVRFIDPRTNREVSVFAMPFPVTGLRLSDDGNRLVIWLADGTARIWDIRNVEDRAGAERERWAERRPAGAYLDELWAGPTPTDALRGRVQSDEAMSPLRRVVAGEMLEGRLDGLARDAALAYEGLIKDQTDGAAVRAAATNADLPRRVKERVEAAVAEWAKARSK